MSKLLFHLWNYYLNWVSVSRSGETPPEITSFYYNNNNIIVKFMRTKGYQESIFNDEILGNAQMSISRELSKRETVYLKNKYPELNNEKMDELILKLSSFHTGEMVPYYIKRYGFYEGHTGYRADPITLAFIFGLRSIKEINKAFDGKLFERLTQHHTNL